MISHNMQGKLLRQALDKFMKADVAQNARVQVVLQQSVLLQFVSAKPFLTSLVLWHSRRYP